MAINRSLQISKKHNLINQNSRTILFTDSLNNFNNLITYPRNRKKIKHKPLWESTVKLLKELKIILWKIKSHTTPSHYYNELADESAKIGATSVFNNTSLPAPLNDHSLRHCDIKIYPQRINTFRRNTCVRRTMDWIDHRSKPP